VLPAMLGVTGCAAPPPHEPDPERVFAERPLQRPDGTPLAAFPTSAFGLGFGRSEFELWRDCEAAGGRLPPSRETWYGAAPEPEPWACLDLPAPGMGSGRILRASATFCQKRSCELAFSGVPISGDVALGPLMEKYGSPVVREPRIPCPASYGDDVLVERVTVAWTWLESATVRATIVFRQTCEDATLTYTDVARAFAGGLQGESNSRRLGPTEAACEEIRVPAPGALSAFLDTERPDEQ
jgi:hypothetical protein